MAPLTLDAMEDGDVTHLRFTIMDCKTSGEARAVSDAMVEAFHSVCGRETGKVMQDNRDTQLGKTN